MRQEDRGPATEVSELPPGFKFERTATFFDELARGRLKWLIEEGFGFLEIASPVRYDRAYFDKYAGYAQTEIGRALNASRVAFVARHWQGAVLDIGIGSGAFIEERMKARREEPTRHGATFGFDVNPAGVDWLNVRRLYLSPYHLSRVHQPIAATFFDVLEHIADFRPVLEPFAMVFVAIPIFDGPAHARTSKHYRRDEHCWYFTAAGLIRVFDSLGFDVIEEHDEETRIGREDIRSFAFARR